MTLLQLQYFYTLARICHYTRAAQELNISQPALSYSIRELEREIGGKLFEKRSRKVELTAYGKTLLPYVESALFQLEKGLSAVSELIGNEKSSVSVGYFHSIAGSVVPQLIKGFYQQEDHRKVQFELMEGISDEVLSALLVGKLDFAFATQREDWVESVQIQSQPLYLAVPIDHPLAKTGPVTFEQFAREPQIAMKKPSNLRSQIDCIFRDRGTEPDIAFEVRDCTTALQYVGMTLGTAVVPDISSVDRSRVSILPIQDPKNDFSRPIYFAWSKSRALSPSAELVKNYVLEHGLFEKQK